MKVVVVGGGISGLAAAFFYRRAAGSSARILVLDNHDDFGGHAKRNEFTLDGRLVIGYGGSESIDSPNTHYSEVAKGLLRDLGVEIARFETAFERTLYSSLGLSRGIFFAREAFGRDVLVAGEPPTAGADEVARQLANAKPLSEFVAAFPISAASKAQLLALYDGARDPLAEVTALSSLDVRAEVAPDLLRIARPGTPVEVKILSVPPRVFLDKVAYVVPSRPNAQSEARAAIVATIANADGGLQPGTPATITIHTRP